MSSTSPNPLRAPRLSTLTLLTATSIISVNVFLPALPQMSQSFGVSEAQMSWAFSAYLIVTGVLQLVIGLLSDQFGRRPVLVVCLALFFASSVAASLSPNLITFFIARFVQGAVIGGAVVSQAVVRDTSSGKAESAQKLATIAMIMALGPMLAPIIGGVLTDLIHWRANFWLLTVLGALVFAICWVDLIETNQNKGAKLAVQLQHYKSVFSTLKFWGYAMVHNWNVAAFYSFLMAIPIVGTVQLGLNSTMVAILMALLPIGYLTGNSWVRRNTSRFSILQLILIGRAIGLASPALSLGLLITGVPTLIALLPLIGVGVSNGFCIPTSNAGAISLNPKAAGAVAGMVQSMALFLGFLNAALTAWIMAIHPTAIAMTSIIMAIALIAVLPTAIVWFTTRQKSE